MKRKIGIGCGVLVLAALVWVGARNISATAETDNTAADNEIAVMASAEDPSEEVDAAKTTKSAADSTESSTAEDKEEGLLYRIETSDTNNLGMVPIVNGSAVVLLDGSYTTTYQGDYEPEELDAFSLKMENELAKAASNGKIGEWAFYREAMLKDFEFPEGVTAIERFAFARSSLSSAVIPEGVTSIGLGAFYHCDSLTEVTIPDSVTMIEENAFSHTPWLEDWLAGGREEEEMTEASAKSTDDDFLIVGDGILLAYRGSEKNPHLPAGVKSVVPGVLEE